MTPLARLTSLKLLYLDGTQVSDVAPLAKLRCLETLSLVGTPVKDVTPLAELNNLKTLRLIRTQISKDNYETLRGMLPSCQIE